MRLWLTDYHVVSLVSQTPFSSLHKVILRENKQEFLAETFNTHKIPTDEQHRLREYLELYRRSTCNHLMKIYKLIEDRSKQQLTVIMQKHGNITLEELYTSYRHAGLAVPEPMLWNILAQITNALQALRQQDTSFYHANILSENCFIDEETGILRLGLFLPFTLKYEEEEKSTRESISSLIEKAQRKIKGLVPALTSCVQNFSSYGQSLTFIFPPEVFRGIGLLSVSDMWMVGCLLFEGCNGYNPFLENLNTVPSPQNLFNHKVTESISFASSRALENPGTLSRQFMTSIQTNLGTGARRANNFSNISENSLDITLVDNQQISTYYPNEPLPSLTSMAMLPSISSVAASTNKGMSFEGIASDTNYIQYDFTQFTQRVLAGKRSLTNTAYSRNLQIIIDLCLTENAKMRMTLETLLRHPLIVKFTTNTKDEMTLKGKLILYSESIEKSTSRRKDSFSRSNPATNHSKKKSKRRINILNLEEPISLAYQLIQTDDCLSDPTILKPLDDIKNQSVLSDSNRYSVIQSVPFEDNQKDAINTTYLTDIRDVGSSSNLFSDELESIYSTNISTTDDFSLKSESLSDNTVVCDFDNLVSGKREEEPCTILMVAALRNDTNLIKENRKSDLRRRCPSGKTALMFAAQQGHVEAVKLLIKEAKMKKLTGKTALMIAAEQGHHEVVSLLMNEEAGIEDKDRWTALMRAAWFGHIVCCELLSAEESRFTRKNGWTALMCAAYRGHARVCKVLAPHEAGMYTTAGYTALMYAARYGHYECCKILAPYETGMKNRHRQTALTIATERKYGKVAMLLLRAETDQLEQETQTLRSSQSHMSQCTPIGSIRNSPHGGSVGLMTPYRPLDIDSSRRPNKADTDNGSMDKGKLRLSDLYGAETISQCSELQETKDSDNLIIQGSLFYKADPISLSSKDSLSNISFNKSSSQLTSRANSRPGSAEKKYIKSNISASTLRLNSLLSGHVKLSLKQRSDFRINCNILHKKEETYTELMVAALKEDLQSISKLIVRQATLQTERGRTSLMLCAEKGLIHSVRLLVGREEKMQDKSGWTALMYAAISEAKQVVAFLAEKEARIQDFVGNTALMLAARCGHCEVVKILKKYELCMQDKNGWTAMMHAIDADQLECVNLLISGEFNIIDNRQLSVLDYCKEGPIKEILMNYYLCGLQ